MFAVCVESSHARGMGHFFRAVNLVAALGRAGKASRIYINGHEPALRLLESAVVVSTTPLLLDV